MISVKQHHLIIAAFSLLFLFLLTSNNKVYHTLNGSTQGTTFHIEYRDKPGRNHEKQIHVLLQELDKSLSIYNTSSLISAINRNETIELDAHLKSVLEKALEVSLLTGGAFDITIGPLAKIYGFGSGKKMEIIDYKTIDSIRNFVGWEKISIQNKRVEKTDSRVQLDLNAIAKGYSVDAVALFFEQKKVSDYLVEIGGEVRTRGLNSKGIPWRIGIDKPIEGNLIPGMELQEILNISGMSLATSGNYRKHTHIDGIKYTHTINPRTGYPARHTLLSATIVANDCMTADAYATACMVMGVEESQQLISRIPELECYLIFSDAQGNFLTYFSEGFEAYLE